MSCVHKYLFQKVLLPAVRLCWIFFFLLLPAQGLIAENIFYEFGPKTDKVIVFTASAGSDNQATAVTLQLQKYAQKLSADAPDTHIIVAITKNDVSELPVDIPVKRYEGTKALIQTLSAYPNAAVCLVAPDKFDNARIITGTSKGTTPAWFLKTVYTSLEQENISVDFYTNAVVFHRLGWLPDDPALRLYNEANIPAIKIETGADLSFFFSSVAPSITQSMSNEWDTHYFVFKLHKKLVIINEQHIVITLIVSSIAFLLWLMFFSFLFGKKRDQHIRDLFKLWWMPIYFFLVNWLSFFLGAKIAETLFYLRFSSVSELSSFPLTALLIKYVFALFFMFTVTAFNKFIPLPANRFIYGFIAHVVCLLNIFIFSFINLSFSIIFMVIYFVSLAAYHFKNIVLQIIFIVCLFLPLMPFVMHIILYREYMIHIIFLVDIAPACIFVPFDLFLIRLSLSFDKKRKVTKPLLRIPIQCKVMGGLFLVLAFWVFVIPMLKTTARNRFMLIQQLNGDKSGVVKKYINSSTEESITDYTRGNIQGRVENADRFLTVRTSFENYFERSIGTIAIDSSLKIEAFSVTLRALNDIAIFESDVTFEQNSSGDTAMFISSPRPSMPFIIHFSGKKDAALTLSVVVWSNDNPFEIKLPVDNSKDAAGKTEALPFLLKIEKTLHITAEGKG